MTSLRDRAVIYLPPTMDGAKRALVEKIGSTIGGGVSGNLKRIADDAVPIICCAGELAHFIPRWNSENRTWVYWDRGYVRRPGGLWPPLDKESGFYRWHVCAFQMRAIADVPPDRWKRLGIELAPWRRNGKKIVVATTGDEYAKLHRSEGWLSETLNALKSLTDRPVVVRDKGSTILLATDLHDAHCLVSHGSNAAIEAVILGCPVYVHESSAASLVGRTELKLIETPDYPERQPWLNALAYSQFDDRELFDGTLWGMIS